MWYPGREVSLADKTFISAFFASSFVRNSIFISCRLTEPRAGVCKQYPVQMWQLYTRETGRAMKKRIKETGKRHMPPQSANETGNVSLGPGRDFHWYTRRIKESQEAIQ